ncbi:MAG: ABC transporter permease [Gammaproteobacteria bacterium]
METQAGWVELGSQADGAVLRAGGCWNVNNAGRLDGELNRLVGLSVDRVVVDVEAVETLDTAGAWLIYRTVKFLRSENKDVRVRGARHEHKAMLETVAANDQPCPISPPPVNTVVRVMAQVGEVTVSALVLTRDFVAFFGEAVAAFGRALVRPWRLRLTSLVYQMEQVGFNALPIVGLISFLIGVVLAYQGATQLQRLGADVFVVDLIAVSILREIGILLTAIVIAGRSGSAFTAQLGSMKANEEIDAMRTLGLDPMDVLVLPRVLALVLTLPMLAFFADMMGLLGGGLMVWFALDISPAQYIERLRDALDVGSFWVGIIKAPFFAGIIALVGCYEGMQVKGSAESVGQHTTRAVVEAIFLVIVVDAMFSIFFNFIGI